MVYRALDAVEDGLLGIPLRQLGFGSGANSSKSSTAETVADEARDEIENGVHQLETLLESTVDKSFDMFELYTLRNILTVPDDLTPWMQLKHYEVCSPSATPPPLHQNSRRATKTNIFTPGPTTPTSPKRTNTRIHPPPPAQSPRNPQTKPRSPLHTRPQRGPNLRSHSHPLPSNHPVHILETLSSLPHAPPNPHRPLPQSFLRYQPPHYTCAFRNLPASGLAAIGQYAEAADGKVEADGRDRGCGLG